MTTRETTQAKARETIQNLAALQDIDDEIADIELERGNLPEELKKLAAKIAEFETFIEDKRQELVDTEHRSSESTNHLADARDRLARYQQQLYAVKTTREYDAITTEIETAKSQVSEYEQVISGGSSRRAELTAILEERETELESLRERETEKSAELKEKLAATEDEERGLREQRDRVVAKILPKIYEHYERIRDVKGGRGVVRLTGGACGGCFAMIPPQLQVEIRKATDLAMCESCGRFIVPDFDLE